MVGLRWWNKVEEDGTSTWMFESKKVLSMVRYIYSLFLRPEGEGEAIYSEIHAPFVYQRSQETIRCTPPPPTPVVAMGILEVGMAAMG